MHADAFPRIELGGAHCHFTFPFTLVYPARRTGSTSRLLLQKERRITVSILCIMKAVHDKLTIDGWINQGNIIGIREDIG